MPPASAAGVGYIAVAAPILTAVDVCVEDAAAYLTGHLVTGSLSKFALLTGRGFVPPAQLQDFMSDVGQALESAATLPASEGGRVAPIQ